MAHAFFKMEKEARAFFADICLTQSNTKKAMSSKTFYSFAEAINKHDIDGIYTLMTDDHTFVDAQGNKVTGREKMKYGWSGYFQLFPDYRIEIESVFENVEKVAAFGFAGGTFKGLITANNENYWRLPAAWQAIVENNRIKLWQVYSDTKIPFEIIAKNK